MALAGGEVDQAAFTEDAHRFAAGQHVGVDEFARLALALGERFERIDPYALAARRT